MNRKLKFRAWENHTKRFIDDGFSIAMDGTEIYDDNGTSYDESGFILMQFTGLIDPNGKEVFEGDIQDKGYAQQVVCFDPRGRFFGAEIIRPSNDLGANGKTPYELFKEGKNATEFDNLIRYDDVVYPVIGNIFENSNLLK